MCYYNSQKVRYVDYVRLKLIEKDIRQISFLNRELHIGFDYSMNAVLKPIPDREDFDIGQMEWGFIPFYLKARDDVQKMRFGYKDAAGKFKPPITTLNASSEEMLAPGKIYRDAALHRRCLVLSTGFFEWRHIHGINKRTGEPLKTADKYPYYITVKDKRYFYMAGIWQPWTDKATGEHVESFAVVTTAANSIMAQVHNSKKRMPTILKDDLAYEWMFGKLDEPRIREIGMTQFPADRMEVCSIAKDFREQLEPSKPFAYEELPALELAV